MTAEARSLAVPASAIVAEHLARPAAGWAVGTVGAVAEFMRTSAEKLDSDRASRIVTARGALCVETTPDTWAVTFKAASGLTCIAFCLPEARARLNGRAVLTELGRDQRALRPCDREAILFDLGVDSPFFDFCVRTTDPVAAQSLRRHVGSPLFGAGNGALLDIAALQPHRVVCSRLARIEVYQPIADAGAATPDGPHTHLLPDLLAAGRHFAGDEPIPAGWIPCAHLYPRQLPAHLGREAAHPVR